jgi:hypothetical protein
MPMTGEDNLNNLKPGKAKRIDQRKSSITSDQVRQRQLIREDHQQPQIRSDKDNLFDMIINNLKLGKTTLEE